MQYLCPDLLAYCLSQKGVQYSHVYNFFRAMPFRCDDIWQRLTYLEIDCTYMVRHQSWPRARRAVPNNLKTLKISADTKITTLSPSCLSKSLEEIDCSGCSSLKTLPNLCEETPLLKQINLTGCGSIQSNLDLPIGCKNISTTLNIPIDFWIGRNTGSALPFGIVNGELIVFKHWFQNSGLADDELDMWSTPEHRLVP